MSDLIYGFAAYLGVETIIGPFYFGYGWTEGGHHGASTYLGRTF